MNREMDAGVKNCPSRDFLLGSADFGMAGLDRFIVVREKILCFASRVFILALAGRNLTEKTIGVQPHLP